MHRNDSHAGKRCAHAPVWCRIAMVAALSGAAVCANAVTLGEKAKENGCIGAPVATTSGMYKCPTSSGPAYFNVPGAESRGPETSVTRATTTPTPSGFQRVDPATQKGRDDVRRKVLAEELATEEQLLAEARITYANGAPAPLPEEQTSADKYRERIARLRQSVQLHERNID